MCVLVLFKFNQLYGCLIYMIQWGPSSAQVEGLALDWSTESKFLYNKRQERKVYTLCPTEAKNLLRVIYTSCFKFSLPPPNLSLSPFLTAILRYSYTIQFRHLKCKLNGI